MRCTACTAIDTGSTIAAWSYGKVSGKRLIFVRDGQPVGECPVLLYSTARSHHPPIFTEIDVPFRQD